MSKEKLEIKRFTTDNVIPTNTLRQKNKSQLIKIIERLEFHCMQLDQGLTLTLENIQYVKTEKHAEEAEKLASEMLRDDSEQSVEQLESRANKRSS